MELGAMAVTLWASLAPTAVRWGQVVNNHQQHYVDGGAGMFSQNSFAGYGQGFGFFPGSGGDYSTWGTAANSGQPAAAAAASKGYPEEYYRGDYDQAGVSDRGLKHLEQGLRSLALGADKDFGSKEPYGKDPKKLGGSDKKLSWASVSEPTGQT
ncbi:hypothetical protein HPB51_015285 [Rhipicephalus microplus]|uniref:Uncharacterized protein n=1 Tax=Rhipicephalus microplus TaxID=6941 RepID=A0A9J6DV81_RHIMP|nr:hypothetical protein HPB51_015285 [Rhipicephalus microplus]